MDSALTTKPRRLPRFRRAPEPPAFRLTEDDVLILLQLARHRMLRSTHIAALVGRSLDRTNDRLQKLFHAGYVDRPREQLDRFPTGSPHYAYALADLGLHLLKNRYGMNFANPERSRKNREAHRYFIEHQLEINDFYLALQTAAVAHGGVRFIHQDELIEGLQGERRTRNHLTFRARLSDGTTVLEVGTAPDLAVGLGFPDSTRRCFTVEIDRGTMPVVRSDLRKTSFARKMRVYLSAYAAKQHERQLGWKAFRVLTVTTDEARISTMRDALRHIHVPGSPGAALFFFITRNEVATANSLLNGWTDGNGRDVRLV